MTDIMNSPAVKQVMKQPGHVSADGAAQAQGEQPIRAAVVRAAELARDAESNARTRQHAKGKMTARERLGLLLDTGSFEGDRPVPRRRHQRRQGRFGRHHRIR